MRVFKILSHPYALIFSFLLIMISGEHFGGFYAIYILMALPFAGIHALLAVAGIVVLILNYSLNKSRVNHQYRVINIIGFLLLVASLIYFFLSDNEHYNWGTFEQVVPIVTIIIATVISCCFLVGNFDQKTTVDFSNDTSD